MATQKIEYQNKVAIDDVGVPEKNKITADNMNEIKEVVNNNADNFDETTAATNERIDTANNAINNIVENTYTKTETDEKLAQKADTSDIPTDLSQLSNATTKFVNETQLQEETTARENADNDLQGQIDAIVASSDVVDIVGTYQELENYDTSHLGDNDIIKVLQDSTHNNATSYYRWKKHTSTWQYIGSEGPYYTKSESNEKFVEKETGKGLSSNDFTNAYREKLDGIESGAEVNIIEKIKLNGTELPISNKEINIPVDDTLNNTSTNPIQNKKVFEALEGKEDSSNKTDTLNPESTSTQYPNAEVVYNALVEKQNQIDELQEENNKLKADHPPINETGTELTLNGTGDFDLALSPKGNITQDGEPSPNNEIPVKVVDGEYEVTVSNSDNTQSQIQTIDTSPNPLYSENDYYYKSNGEWYVHNEFKEVIFTGASSENWSKVNNYNMYYITINDIQQNVSMGSKIGNYSNYFKELSANEINARNEGFSIGVASNLVYFYTNDYSTLEDFKTWLSTHNTTIIYKLATPTNTEITNTTLINSLEALANMLAYQDQTNISQTHNETQADMKINAKTIMSMRYMQSEIEELKQAILNS